MAKLADVIEEAVNWWKTSGAVSHAKIHQIDGKIQLLLHEIINLPSPTKGHSLIFNIKAFWDQHVTSSIKHRKIEDYHADKENLERQLHELAVLNADQILEEQARQNPELQNRLNEIQGNLYTLETQEERLKELYNEGKKLAKDLVIAKRTASSSIIFASKSDDYLRLAREFKHNVEIHGEVKSIGQKIARFKNLVNSHKAIQSQYEDPAIFTAIESLDEIESYNNLKDVEQRIIKNSETLRAFNASTQNALEHSRLGLAGCHFDYIKMRNQMINKLPVRLHHTFYKYYNLNNLANNNTQPSTAPEPALQS